MEYINNDVLTPIAVQSQAMAYSNLVYLSNQSGFPPHMKYVIVKNYILTYSLSDQIPNGKIGVNKKFREFLVLSLIDKVHVKVYSPKPSDQAAPFATFKIQLIFAPTQRTEIDDINLIEVFKKKFDRFYLGVDQIFALQYQGKPYLLTVQKISGNEDGVNVYLGKETKINCVANGQQSIRLKSTKNKKQNVFAENFKMESLGIGGLDAQLNNIFRRAFASRRLPHSIMEKFGLKHVKGILLYGPPGTGKTLIARQLAKFLKAKSCQVVNGPQIFGKYVGQSQENVRKYFQQPKKDEKKYGQQSPLHVIVFDQIDAICRQRGSDTSGTNAKDAVVNQILTNLDGVEALNNIIVIGMTNRKDLIDEAVLRPGRLEVHVQIGLPNEQGRVQILSIHTQSLQNQKLLDSNVSLKSLAALTKNYTGAQLQAVVKNAASYAMTKGNDIMDFSKNFKLQKGTTVTMNDFMKAIEEVVPSFGIDQQQFGLITRDQLVNYGDRFKKTLTILKKTQQITINGHSQLNSILLYGPPGSGKTSIAAHFAKNCSFAYVKIISPERLIGVSFMGKIAYMYRVFNDAYKSKESLIIIDNIERLIEYVQIGPDFNNYIMQVLLTLLGKIPPNPQSRLLIIGTTSNYSAIDLLDINKAFKVKLKIEELNEKQIIKVLGGVNLGISSAPVKKIVQFKQVIKGKPQSIWGDLWGKFV